jgi:hypothetical protein
MRIRPAIQAAGVGALLIVGGAATASAAPPLPTPERDSAEWTVTDGYFVKQSGCTPDTPGDPEFITWDAPGFLPSIGGTGMIHDSNPQLGGQFSAHWVPSPGYWDVEYQFC